MRRARLHAKPPIVDLPARQRAQRVRAVCERLEKRYGRPRFGNPRRPTNDLVFIVLSNKTDPRSARAAYRRLRRLYPKWEDAINDGARRMRAALEPAGLATIKTRLLRAALRKIAADFGSCSLRRLRSWPQEEVESYLVGLPGVSLKVAKCIMLYTMDFAVLPVDAHVHRVASRLGWTRRKRADQCHEELEALVPPHRRFAFHVDCIAHGRAICRPRDPLCDQCCIAKHCCFYQQAPRGASST